MTVFTDVKVLIVEDEFTVAMMIEDALAELGCRIVSSSSRVPHACEIAETADIDVAVLDVNVAGQPVFPVAEILRRRRVPMLFSTGYGVAALPPAFSSHPVLSKPFSDRELQQSLALCITANSAANAGGV